MAFYDLEEQEQLSALEAWWKQWGVPLLLGIVLLLGAAPLPAIERDGYRVGELQARK